ncbi:DUF934 domain-containing protein [Endozoicomonas elysicola]|uniref:Oxidoreductase n=1 Tax=Endozoicomonas elysicola TaxID=305900 RepID=A0A081KCA8_9GAMM|nr:DUF934 domain-containing protein [Endozoicomonas elysicola]KEI71784.1 hypothetical protein GV64_14485 [Endozoicomonas elysicola]
MPKLLKGQQISNDHFQILDQNESEASLPEGNLLLHVSAIDAAIQANTDHNGQIGIWFDSADEPEMVADALNQFEVIAVNFPKFMDGRGYSIARLLRERFNYRGDVRAIGDVLVDQLYYLQRCGFSSFRLREDQNPDYAVEALTTFSTDYQTAADNLTPVYRLRHQL